MPCPRVRTMRARVQHPARRRPRAASPSRTTTGRSSTRARIVPSPATTTTRVATDGAVACIEPDPPYEANFLSRGAISEDKLFYRVHGRYYTFDSMYRNILDGQKVGDEESYNFNAALEYRPGGRRSSSAAGKS